MSCVQDRVSNLVVKSTTAGKQVFSATMYIPSKALELTGEVFISSKNFVFAFTKVKQKKITTGTGSVEHAFKSSHESVIVVSS